MTVVDPAASAGHLDEAVEALARQFEPGDVAGRWLVIAATDSAAVNEAVEACAEEAGVWVNRADRGDGGPVAFGAALHRGRVEVGITTGGASPTLARWVRDRIDAALPAELEALAELLSQERRPGRSRSHRSISFEDVLDALRAVDLQRARQLVTQAE